MSALTLTIRTFVSAKADALVKLDTKPSESLKDIFLCTWYKAIGVCILDTEHQVPTMLACKKIVK
jgi:hypothetical protein